jgi:hypothetical protein
MGINLSRGAIGIAKRLPEEILVAATAPIAPQKPPEKVRKPANPTPETNPVQFFSKSETKQIIDKFKPLPPILRIALRDTQALHMEFKAIERSAQPLEPQADLGAGNRNQETTVTQKEDFSVKQTGLVLDQSFKNQPKPPFEASAISETPQPQVLKPSNFLDRVISALTLNRPPADSVTLRLGRQRVFEAFQRRVRSGAIHDFAEQARQVVRSLEAHPLTQTGSLTEVITHQNVRFGGVASTLPIPSSTDFQVNSASFRTETVAQIPSHDDNGVRSQPVQDREKRSLVSEPEKGPKNPPLRDVSAPPLLNLNPPQRPLPTNVRSRLVSVSSVNLLDLVL